MADWELRGDVLASARQAAGLSQEELAAAVHVANEERIALWERGRERPQARFIPVLAARLGISPLSLLDGDPDHPDLAHLRVAAGLNLQEMAQRVGLATTTYHRLERRGAPRRSMSAATLEAIGTTLGITAAQARDLISPAAS